MELTVGAILEGKVKSITNFGAFIYLPEGRTGLVHISEVSSSFVNDIHEHLKEGQTVKVKVLSIDPNGKISLSIKRAAAPPPRTQTPRAESARRSEPPRPREPLTFEEKLKQLMSDSDSRIAGCRQYEHKTKSRRR